MRIQWTDEKKIGMEDQTWMCKHKDSQKGIWDQNPENT